MLFRSRPGAELVFDLLGMRERVAASDLVVTGEGRFDRTSLEGKAPWALVQLAREEGTPWVILCGEAEAEAPDGIVAALGKGPAAGDPERSLAALAEEVSRGRRV